MPLRCLCTSARTCKVPIQGTGTTDSAGPGPHCHPNLQATGPDSQLTDNQGPLYTHRHMCICYTTCKYSRSSVPDRGLPDSACLLARLWSLLHLFVLHTHHTYVAMSNYSWGLMPGMAALSLPVILDLADCHYANAITRTKNSTRLSVCEVAISADRMTVARAGWKPERSIAGVLSCVRSLTQACTAAASRGLRTPSAHAVPESESDSRADLLPLSKRAGASQGVAGWVSGRSAPRLAGPGGRLGSAPWPLCSLSAPLCSQSRWTRQDG